MQYKLVQEMHSKYMMQNADKCEIKVTMQPDSYLLKLITCINNTIRVKQDLKVSIHFWC
uniref:Uncharacterized protein n=1 Tax=Arundo donax TaxID=35708 RepID=A0A0A8YTY9_ARUDO